MFTKEVVTVRPGDTLARAIGLMDEKGVGAVVVVEDQRPVGIITDRDVAIALGARGSAREAPVQDVMTCPVTTMRQDEGVFRATQHMMRHALRRVPVVDSVGRLAGLVTLDDLLILLTRELDNLARSVEPEVAAACTG
jgi:CBS domain-containing protein